MLHAEVPVEPRNSRSAWTIFRVEELCHHCGASTVGPPGDIGRRACFAAVARVSVDHEVEIAADRRIVRFGQPTAADGGPATPPDRASPTEELGERALGLRKRLLRHLKQRGHGSIGRYRVPMRPATIRRGRRAAGSRFRTRSVTMIEANGLATGRDAAVGQAGATGGRLDAAVSSVGSLWLHWWLGRSAPTTAASSRDPSNSAASSPGNQALPSMGEAAARSRGWCPRD